MSGSDYGAMTTARLLEMFVANAKAAGNMLSRSWIPSNLIPEWQEKLKPTLERMALGATIQAIGAELCKRSPIDEIRRLMVDDDPDVRGWAGIIFLRTDSEWASSAVGGLLNGISTREVLALKKRVGETPPARPTLPEMSEDELVARFVDAATREFATRFTDWDVDQSAMDLRNDIRREIWDVMQELKARGALGELAPLMASPNPTVRREAATACLRTAAEQSMAVLDDIAANGGDDDKYAAKDALIHWREKGVVVSGV